MKKLDIEEYYDLLAIELCRTVYSYIEEKGSLSNYFKMRADNLVNKEYAKTQLQKRLNNGHVPLTEVYDYISNGDDIAECVELDDFITEDKSDILRMKLDGYTQSEIAGALGLTQSYVSRVLSKKRKGY